MHPTASQYFKMHEHNYVSDITYVNYPMPKEVANILNHYLKKTQKCMDTTSIGKFGFNLMLEGDITGLECWVNMLGKAGGYRWRLWVHK